jgi:hypothetical protein
MLDSRCAAALMAACLVAAVPQVWAQERSRADVEKTVAVVQLPRVVLDAARAALGTAPTDAKVKTENGREVYEITGTTVYFKKVTVAVAADGTIVRPVSPWDSDDD